MANVSKLIFGVAIAAVSIATPALASHEGKPISAHHHADDKSDLDRIRIDRQTLEPGQSTGLHTHTLMSLGVCVSPARVEYSEPGGKTETADLEAGQFNWHPTARTHSLKNVGKTRFEAVEIEWK